MIEFELGICGDAQESSFMNATLQNVNGSPLEFSIAVYVDINAADLTEGDVEEYLEDVFAGLSGRPDVNVRIQIGPEGAGDDF